MLSKGTIRLVFCPVVRIFSNDLGHFFIYIDIKCNILHNCSRCHACCKQEWTLFCMETESHTGYCSHWYARDMSLRSGLPSLLGKQISTVAACTHWKGESWLLHYLSKNIYNKYEEWHWITGLRAIVHRCDYRRVCNRSNHRRMN